MKKIPQITLTVIIGVSALCSTQAVFADTEGFKWRTVVDNNKSPPGILTEKYFSYNQPSLNDNALVVFRARAKIPTGGQGGGEPTRGISSLDKITNL